MQSSDIPSKSPIVWASSAAGTSIRTIPQTTTDPSAASFALGFPPQTFTNESAGGTPPDGRDFNGIYNFLDAWARWQQAGAPIAYDSAFQTAIGGYPKGVRILSALYYGRVWISTVDNNTTNPDGGGAGWVTETSTTYNDYTSAGTYSVTVPAWATHAEVHFVGGGGGGAPSAAGYSGGGGGAGGYAFGVLSVTPGTSLPVVVGAGGQYGVSGGLGGISGITGYGGVTGGASGMASTSTSAGGVGGNATATGLRNFTGGTGGDGNSQSQSAVGGNGAAGPFGGQGRAGAGGGTPGVAPGAGGGGAWLSNGSGGNGADGAVLIRWLP